MRARVRQDAEIGGCDRYFCAGKRLVTVASETGSVSPTDPTNDKSRRLIWVSSDGGRPRVHWRRVAAAMVAFAAVNSLGAVINSRVSEMPINVFGIFGPLCVFATYLVLVVELQLQRAQHATWHVRYSLRAMLLMTALAAVFFGAATSAMRANQRSFAVNQTVMDELEAVLTGGGTATISMSGGRCITCQVTRAGFSDDDLGRLIRAASRGESGRCELSTLFLGGTSIAEAGVRQLAVCKKLTFVELPSLELSDEALAGLAECRSLQFLFLDEHRLKRDQLDQLRRRLPKLRLNGKTWSERNDTP